MFCSACGTQVDGQFCTACGQPVASVAPNPVGAQPVGQTVAQPAAQPVAHPFAASPNQAAAAGRPGARYIGQWNWGAFLLCPFWLMNHGRVGLGIVYLILTFIPIANIACVVIGIWSGIKGNAIAVQGRAFADDAQFVAVQRAWTVWGVWVLIVSVVVSFGLGVIVGILQSVSSH